jgi:hypothetical protein
VHSNERIDNTVAISVAYKNSGKSWKKLTATAKKRAEAARFNGWVCAQEYINTKDNDLSDPLSRDVMVLFRQNAYRRGLTIMIHIELDKAVRDTSFHFEVTPHINTQRKHTTTETTRNTPNTPDNIS